MIVLSSMVLLLVVGTKADTPKDKTAKAREIACNVCRDVIRAFEGSLAREQGNITSAATDLCQSLFDNNRTFEKICEKVLNHEIETLLTQVLDGADDPSIPDVCNAVFQCGL